MDKIEKALRKLSPAERKSIKAVLRKIIKREIEGLDIKKLKGRGDIFRVRKGNIRIIYRVNNGETHILNISNVPIVDNNHKYNITHHIAGCYYDLSDHVARFLNHSCQPNLMFNKEKGCFSALQDINKMDILTFDYETTEPEIVNPFFCGCGSDNCKVYINGYDNPNKNQFIDTNTINCFS